MSCFRRRRSPSPAKPHHAGVAYRMDATVVALATRWSSCGWRPWVRRSLHANIEEEQVFKTCETWSVMVNLALGWTPTTLSVVTLSMNGCDGGCMDLVLAQHVGVVGKFCNLVLPVLRMEFRGCYHICDPPRRNQSHVSKQKNSVFD